MSRPSLSIELEVAQGQIRELFRRLEAVERETVKAARPALSFPLLRDTVSEETKRQAEIPRPLRVVKGGRN
jgi:hypothetical protein